MRIFSLGIFVAGLIFLFLPEFATAFNVALALILLCSCVTRFVSLSVVLGLILGGLLVQWVVAAQISYRLSDELTGQDIRVTGVVASVPKYDDRRTSFTFKIEQIEPIGQDTMMSVKRISLNWYGKSGRELRAGQRWQLFVRLKPPAGLGNPGGFDYERWLFHSRIHATGYVRDKPLAPQLLASTLTLAAIRQRLSERLSKLDAANETTALVQGLTVGISNNISTAHWATLRQSGTAHLLAISGLHIGLISAWAYFVARWVWLGVSVATVYTRRRTSAETIPVHKTTWGINKITLCIVLSLGCALAYAALAGFSLPTVRALIMLSIVAFAIVCRRIWPATTAILFALLVVLLLDPLVLLSVGFWLSFGTVAALIYLHNGRLHRHRGMVAGFKVHLQLGLVLLPATAWFFQQGALVAPIANLIAVPVVGMFVVPLSLITLATSFISVSVANWLLIAVQWVLEQLLVCLDLLLRIPAANQILFLSEPIVLFGSLAALVLFFAPRGLSLRWLSLPLVAPAIVINLLGKPVDGFELHVLDVGQGLAAVIFTKEHTVLFDTGKKISANSSMVERVVQPFLHANGRHTLDHVVISHADDDHAGGLSNVLSLFPKASLWASDESNLLSTNASRCEAGKTFVLDKVRFVFLHPAKHDLGSKNDQSCVMLVYYEQARVLLTGDIEAQAEQRLVDRMSGELPVNVLIAPHHGSATSSTTEFVNLLRPQHVIFAAGQGNKFGFPDDEVVARYAAIGAETYTTGDSGAISVVFNSQGLLHSIKTHWQQYPRFRRRQQ